MNDGTETPTNSAEKLGVYAYWWHRLDNSELCQKQQWYPFPAAHRAILKRCRSLDEVMLSEPFQALWQLMPDEKRFASYMELAALIAWILASVRKSDSNRTLAKAMGEKAGENSDRPIVSTLRFQQLIKSRDIEEFARRLRRVLHQIGDAVSVQVLADEIERWYWQRQSAGIAVKPMKRQVLQWAMDYYAAVSKTS